MVVGDRAMPEVERAAKGVGVQETGPVPLRVIVVEVRAAD
jgi:hypothetical protein